MVYADGRAGGEAGNWGGGRGTYGSGPESEESQFSSRIARRPALGGGMQGGAPQRWKSPQRIDKICLFQSDRWDFWMNSAQHMSPDQNHARAQIDASRGALALARALPPLLCRQGSSHLSGRLVRQLAGSSRYPKRMKGPAIAGGYLFRSEVHTSELQSLMRKS